MEALGIPGEVDEEERIDPLPDNADAWRLFEAMGTQWRSGFNGPEGLIYSEAFRLMTEFGIRKKRRRLDLHAALRVMENEALSAWDVIRQRANQGK